MAQRVLYGALTILVLFAIVWADAAIANRCSQSLSPAPRLLFSRGSLLPLFIVAMLVAGGWELIHFLRAAGAQPYWRFALVMVVLVGVAPWLCFGLSYRIGSPIRASLIAVLLSILGTGIVAVAKRDPTSSLRDSGATLLAILYLGFLGSFALHIRSGLYLPGSAGAWVLLVVLLITKASDIGAYFAGSLWGTHKLIPSISPGKSVEGMLGGFAASMLVSALLWSILRAWLFQIDASGHSLPPLGPVVGFTYSLFFGLLISAFGQLGDLFESCFKRDAGLKDSGKVIPRFGGILDLVDSPILAMPVAWLLLTWG